MLCKGSWFKVPPEQINNKLKCALKFDFFFFPQDTSLERKERHGDDWKQRLKLQSAFPNKE